MAYRYVILGSGRQGTAAGYDLARFGDAERVVVADVHLDAARQAAARINELARREVAEPKPVYASETASIKAAISGAHVALSAVPYYFNLAITEAAIECAVSLCDLGGNTEVVWSQLRLDGAARARDTSVVP